MVDVLQTLVQLHNKAAESLKNLITFTEVATRGRKVKLYGFLGKIV
ncbi:MAG: hypothetical protein H7843_15990 [Nitrospirota bacterium]